MSKELYFEDYKIGDEFISPSRTISEADVMLFAGLTGDYNPLHTDEEFAKTTMFKTRIAHGLLGLSIGFGLFTRLGLLDKTALAYLGISSCEFLAPIKLGDTIMSKAKVIAKRETKDPRRGIVTFGMSIVNQREEEVQRVQHTIMIAKRQETVPKQNNR